MHIEQIAPDSLIFPQECRGKYFCSTRADGPDGDPIHRYLQLDGSWGKITRYFDNEEQIHNALSNREQPDFTLSQQELQDRADIRQMVDDGFLDLYDENR